MNTLADMPIQNFEEMYEKFWKMVRNLFLTVAGRAELEGKTRNLLRIAPPYGFRTRDCSNAARHIPVAAQAHAHPIIITDPIVR